MKRPLFVIVMLLIISIGLVFMMKFPQQKSDDVQHQENPLSWDSEVMQSGDNQELTWNTITTGDENPLVYTNTEFWFQLTLPEWWEEYKPFVYHLTEDDIIANISITLPTTIKNWPWVPNPKITHSLLWMQDFSTYITWYANIINILVRSSDSYKQIVKNCKLGTEEECLTKNLTLWNNSYYFTYTTRQELPTDVKNSIKNNWISFIKSSFKSF